ncbi:MAG: SH3 domain-containing protein [Ardenticatenaceae bacterium]|nr:SH3 domain-containing protein [Ardenticatenaceae bacterium]
MLSDAAVKLQEGFARLAGAGDDERLLGMALMSLHGALEEHFREQLAREIVTETQARPGWLELVDLWQKHRVLSPEDRTLILTTNSKRNQIAHGEPFHLSRMEVERYAEFVRNFMGVRARPSRRWGKVEPAIVWDDPGVRPVESPLSFAYWSDWFSSLRPSGQTTPQLADRGTQRGLWGRLRGQMGWLVKMVLVGALALVSFWFWHSWPVRLGITAVILYLIHHRAWIRAGYVYVGGLVYGLGTAVLHLTAVIAFVAALLWPLAAGFYYFTGGTMELPQAELVVPTIERLDGVIEEGVQTMVPGRETAVPAATPDSAAITIHIQVQGNSNVRAEPNTSSAIITIVPNGDIYEVLDVNAERTWYKIRLESGAEGWIGSSRVVEIAP